MNKNNVWQTTRFTIDLTQPKIMGIINITPDSFSDGGKYQQLKAAVQLGENMLENGAAILDIGAESTRPNSQPVPLEQELARLLPVITELVKLKVPISVDTYKPQVMQQVLEMGVDIINDIYALRQPTAEQVIQQFAQVGLCLMHMHQQPQNMQQQPMQGDVVTTVIDFFRHRLLHLKQAKIIHSTKQVVLDPGIGFGKTVAQNFTLLAKQELLNSLNYPWLVGWSRKSSLGAITDTLVAERLIPSVVAAILAVERGARVVRVHDVRQTKQALQIWQASQQIF